MAEITVYGTGYVGLITGLCLVEHGHTVLCADIDDNKIQSLLKRIPPIEEKGLAELLKKTQATGRLTFTSNLQEAFNHGFYHFIAVGTPEGKNGEADLTFVNAVASAINTYRQAPFVIVNKSTVPVGTANAMREMLLKEQIKSGKSLTFDIISNPEFLREGSAISDCLHPDRIIVGGEEKTVNQAINDLYAKFQEQNVPILKMDICSAELTKYAANALLATKISFINELSALAEQVGADIEVVREGIALDPRIGPHFISAGCGYGGSCFPKDVKALSKTFQQFHLQPALLQSVEAVNRNQRTRFCKKIVNYLNRQSTGPKVVALWGLSFKPETDDIRESIAIYIAETLSKEGIKIQAYDPLAMPRVNNLQWIHCFSSPYQALKGAQALVIATEWNIFKEANLEEIYAQLTSPVIFDGRNVLDWSKMQQAAFDYFSIGRSPIMHKNKASRS